MKTLLRSLRGATFGFTLVAALLFIVNSTAWASTTTYVLPLQGFNSGTFPPTGWVDNSYGGWFQASNGDGGANGSAMVDVWDCYDAELFTPTMDASQFATSKDTLYLEFDFWSESDYYSANYGGDQFDVNLYNSGGSTTVKSYNSSTDYTYNNSSSFSWYSNPLTSPSDWRHVKIAIPAAYCTSSLQIGFHGYTPNYACGGDFGIDNVVVSATHYTIFTYAPSTLNFGQIVFGTASAPMSVVVNNPNSTPLLLNTPVLGGANPGDYQIVRAPTSIAPNSSDSFLVTFTPIATGTRNASITVGDNADSPNPIAFNLTGSCVAPTISVAPTTLFSGTFTRLHQSRDQFVLVTSGGAGGLTVSPRTSITGDYPGEYQILRIPASTIPAGQSDTIWIRYSPTMEGSRTAVLNIYSNGVNGVQLVRLLGIGILPRLMVSPQPLNFDSVALGSTVCDSIMLWNPGTDTIAITRNYFASADGDFKLGALTGTDTLIPPDGRKYVPVCFTPQQNGVRQARFRVTTNIPLTFDSPGRDTSTFSVNIIGEGVPYGVLAVRGTPVVDSDIVGQQLCTTDTLYNNGTSDLTITKDSLSGPNASEYTISGVTLPLTIHARSSYVFDVCVVPTARGDRNAVLNVTSTTNGKVVNSQLILDVFGQTVCASLSSQTTGLPTKTCVGSSDTAWVTITNCGDVMTIYTGNLSSNASSYALVGGKSTAGISAGGSARYGIVFTPTARGAAPGSLTITGTGGVNQVVTFDGTGGAPSIAGSVTTGAKVGTVDTFSVMIQNTGECDWMPGVPTVDDPTFAYGGSGATSVIPAGGSAPMTFTYSPNVVGSNTGHVSFPNATEASEPTAAVVLNGSATLLGVSRMTEAHGFVLGQNYPNPFNPTTEIRFTIPQESNVKLDIVDLSGRVVRNVLDARMSAGEHGTVVNATDLASGAYYYQLTAGNIKLTRQMILTK